MEATFDCIIVGGGHAGCEAAMALARLSLRVLLITGNVDRLGHLSCNPAIGGLAKGHMVREIDALGGRMGLWADAAGIQFRTLNSSKGPAVRATRAQIDRDAYMAAVRADIFSQPTLSVWQDTAEDLLVEHGRAVGVRTAFGCEFRAPHLLLTTGTFLRGLIHVGLTHFPGGRLGDAPSEGLSAALERVGLELGRLKTGTTPRILRSSIDFSCMEAQPGDTPLPRFSFQGPGPVMPQVPCHITWTNAATHDAIRAGMDRSPLFTGVIEGTGARYCPSVEDKVARFPDRERHHVFVEPEGLHSPECYVNGLSTSLPLDIQRDFLATIPGLENAKLVRPGYAIEYDYANPIQLFPTLETRVLPGLWLAGQLNGTSGYEEAAAQGLWAALNIFCRITEREPFLPGRDTAYMAVLVDDLVTRGTEEPYRMFTSRAEYRLLLREANADARLTPLGRELGLVDDQHWALFERKQAALGTLLQCLESTTVQPLPETVALLMSLGQPEPQRAYSLAELLRRPGLDLAKLAPLAMQSEQALPFPDFSETEPDVLLEAETTVKYAGYLQRQAELVERAGRTESVALPVDMNYSEVAGLTLEVVEKLRRVTPRTLGQAGRISGVTPAALACLEIHLKKLSRRS